MVPIARFLTLLASALLAFGLDVRKAPSDYQAQGKGGDIAVGVDYMVHSFLADGHNFAVEDYLLVEVGVFPESPTKVHLERFRLRINGKNTLFAQTPGIVAASIKYPDWTQRPTMQATAGPVILGRPQQTGRFPGDVRQPPPIQNPSGIAKDETNPIDYTTVLAVASLPEGLVKKPVAGYIFFAFSGKLKSIKTVELLVDGQPLTLR